MLIVFVFICAAATLSEAAVLTPGNDTELNSHRENVTEDARHLCPEGWTLHQSRCFLYVLCNMSWTKAKQHCQHMSGNLISMHEYANLYEIRNEIRAAAMRNEVACIGGSNMTKEDTLEWVDASGFYLNFWCPRQPNTLVNDCLVVNWEGNGCWNTCEDQYPFVCSK